MVFDNQGGSPEGDASVVRELDPATGEELWAYHGTAAQPFYSQTCGLAQRLENGNTLITESDYGRAFEVTREKDIVWEYYNPHRAGPNLEYIATLFELRRLRPDFQVDWAQKPPR